MSEGLRGIKFYESVAVGLAGLGVVVVVQLLQLGSFDLPLKIALHCFAFSIPILSVFWFLIAGMSDQYHESQLQMIAFSLGS